MKTNDRNKNGLTETEFLEQYEPQNYEKPSVTTDMLLFTIDRDWKKNQKEADNCELKLLLIKRRDHPYINHWALPGGFMNMKESLEETAYRELMEETSLQENVYLEQLYTFSKPDRDPRMRVISTAYMALTPCENIKKTKAGDDASEAKWFSITKTPIFDNDFTRMDLLVLTNEELDIVIKYEVTYDYQSKKSVYQMVDSDTDLAFDHIEIIDMGLQRLRNKVSYTDVAFNLLPELFTLTTLQQVYEILLGEELVKSNFRKKIAPLVMKTEQMRTDCGYHRPYLYRKNPKIRI